MAKVWAFRILGSIALIVSVLFAAGAIAEQRQRSEHLEIMREQLAKAEISCTREDKETIECMLSTAHVHNAAYFAEVDASWRNKEALAALVALLIGAGAALASRRVRPARAGGMA